MIEKVNAYDAARPWQSSAYHLATRYRWLSGRSGSEVHYIEVASGGRILAHAQKWVEFLFCMEGTGTFTLGPVETSLQAGDALWVPRDGVQGLVNEGAGPLRLLLVQQPASDLDVVSLLGGLWSGRGRR